MPQPKCKAIGGGVYLDADGGYWARPWINHRRTWRKLKAVKRAAAYKENATTPWSAPAGNFSELAQLYIDAGCPNKRLEKREVAFCDPEEKRVAMLRKFFGPMKAAAIRLVSLPPYAKWRLRQKLRQGTGERTIDKDLCTLSNVISYGVSLGHLEINYVRSGRPKYRKSGDVRHSREVAPPDADTIHKLADSLFEHKRSEALGWQLLFAMFTGCRTSELLRLRVDAETTDDPGLIQPGFLFLGRRSKGGVNPWLQVGGEFAQMIDGFRYWHDLRFRESPWFFPGRTAGTVSLGALGHALTRTCEELKIPRITPHGLRSFYVTKRRSDGAGDIQIAGEIGDKTVALMQTTYGARPANWVGGKVMKWTPSKGLPSWMRWRAAGKKVIQLRK